VHLGLDASNWRNARGLGRYLRCITRSLAELPQVQVTLFATEDLSDSLPPGCELHWDDRRLPWLSWRLPSLARRYPVDLMLFPTNDAWWHGPVPCAVTVHDLACLHFADRIFRSRWEARLEARRMRRAVQRAARVITSSEASRADILTTLGCPAEKISVIPLGVSEPFTSAPTLSLEEVRQSFGLPEQPYVLYTGGLDFRKNVPMLINAYAALVEEFPDLLLLLVGEYGANRRYYPDIDALMAGTGLGDRLRRLSGVGDEALHTLYCHAQLFVFPSMFEGFGLPPLEAMACGAPVVCSNATSLPEVVGEAAVLFDPLDREALTEAMRGVLSDPLQAEDLRRRGLEHAARFTWSRTAESLVEVLSEVS